MSTPETFPIDTPRQDFDDSHSYKDGLVEDNLSTLPDAATQVKPDEDLLATNAAAVKIQCLFQRRSALKQVSVRLIVKKVEAMDNQL